jgi:hypothetical protein
MPCIPFKNGKHTGWLCISGPRYHYKGFYFENHGYFGPMKTKKNGDLSWSNGKKFWAVVEEWLALPSEEREKFGVED